MQLRYYQQDASDMLDAAFDAGHKAVCLCMPTGAGKTVVFVREAKKYLARGKRVMVVCNRRELIGQAAKKLRAENMFPSLIDPDHKQVVNILYVASIDTLRNRELPEIDVLIIDEAHIRAFDALALYYKDRGARVIGCTATPVRYGKAYLEGYAMYAGYMGNVYDHIVIPITTSELIREGFLKPAITYAPQVDLEGLKVGKDNDYTERSLMEKFNKPKMYKGVIEKYIQFTPNTKAVCFNINVSHSLAMTSEFQKVGLRAVHVDGKTPIRKRDKIFEDFHLGYYDILCNCGVATTGWDEPTVITNIINRATMSLALWLQMVGRTARPCDDIGKTHHNIIDMGMNVYKHLPWEFDRDWSLDIEPPKTKKGVAAIKMCDNLVPSLSDPDALIICDAINYASARKCKCCGYEFPQESRLENLAEGDFMQVDLSELKAKAAASKPLYKMTISELEQYREQKEYAIGWIVRQLITRDETELEQYAAMKGYSKSWIAKQLELLEPSRIETKDNIWTYIQKNLHLSESDIEEYARKKLGSNHNQKQIDFLVPKILEAKRSLHITTY